MQKISNTNDEWLSASEKAPLCEDGAITAPASKWPQQRKKVWIVSILAFVAAVVGASVIVATVNKQNTPSAGVSSVVLAANSASADTTSANSWGDWAKSLSDSITSQLFGPKSSTNTPDPFDPEFAKKLQEEINKAVGSSNIPSGGNNGNNGNGGNGGLVINLNGVPIFQGSGADAGNGNAVVPVVESSSTSASSSSTSSTTQVEVTSASTSATTDASSATTTATATTATATTAATSTTNAAVATTTAASSAATSTTTAATTVTTTAAATTTTTTAPAPQGKIPDCTKIKAIGDDFIKTGKSTQDVVALTNQIRTYVSGVIGFNIPSISWSDALAQGAAIHLKATLNAPNCDLTHDATPTAAFSKPVGQNLYMQVGRSSAENDNFLYAVNNWVRECEAYNARKPGVNTFGSWGHYSQVLAPESTQIGCASATCTNGKGNGWIVTACDYFNPGNNGDSDTIKIGNGY
ncbi:CAP domain-containing protein [Obelidium mucronatum]|nr:CAP domain-containing protein [Obelidium mucronatum]